LIEIGEKNLNWTEELFKTIYADSPIGIEIYDSNGKLIDLNQSCMELFGVSSKEDVKGFDLFNDPNIPIDHLTKLKQRETIRYESTFNFDLVKEHNLYNTTKSGKIYLDVLITPLFIGENKTISNYLVQIQDNSDRKIAERKLINLNEDLEKRVQERTKQLRKSDEEWRILVEDAPDIIFTVDRNRKILYINKIPTGLTKEEALGTDVLDYVDPKYHETVSIAIEKIFRSGESEYYEISARGPNNSTSWYSTRLGAIKQDQEVVSVILITREITERKIMEQKLKESEKRYRTLIENISDIIFEIDLDGKVSYLSPHTIDVLGYTPDELINRNAFRFIHPDDQEEVLENQKYAANTGEVRSVEFRIQHRNGHYVTVSSRGQLIKRDNKKKIVGLFRDISERKIIEELVQQERNKAETYLNLVNVIIVALDKDGKIIMINQKGNNILGWNEGELIGKNWFEYCLPPQDRERVEEYFKKLMKGEVDVVPFYENSLLAKKGEEKLIAWSTILFRDSRGEIAGLLSSGEDITERKLSEIKIQQSEAELSAIYNYTPMAILLVDNERRIRKINKFALKFTNRREKEVFGITGGEALRCLYSISESGGCGFSEYCQDCIIRNTVLDTFNTRIPHINIEGTLFLLPGGDVDKIHLLLSTIPLKFDGEDLVLISLIDITERINAEQKLKESEERYRELFENSPIALFEQDFSELRSYLNTLEASGVVDFENYFEENPKEIIKCSTLIKIIDVNRNALEIYKANSLEDFIRRKNQTENSLYQNLSPELLLVNKRELLSLINGDTTFESESVTETLTGEVIYVYMKTLVIPGFEKTWSKVIVSIVDITNRKITEQKLKESEEKFRTIAEQSSMGVIIQQDGLIKFSNKALSEIIEYPIEEFDNQAVEETYKLIYKEDLPLIIDNYKKVQAGDYESVGQFEIRLHSNSGKIKWVSILTKPIIYLGENAVMSTLIDVTSKKQVEEELKEVSRLKSELLSRTSHELKTPLVSIKGYADLLLSQHYEALDFYTISILHEIKQGCSRLESLIKDLIETSKLESGEIELNKSEEDLTFLIRFCLRDLQGLLETRKHEMVLEIEEDMNTMFEKERIYDVIINLLSNAIKYTPSGGIIRINSKLKNNFYIISIKDNGIGLTKDEMSKIFQKFGKIERYGKGLDVISEGSGLGLYISKNIVELHGGNIWVESQGRNKGSTFYFSLPITDK
jgi:PAS domain S-box-containing protein